MARARKKSYIALTKYMVPEHVPMSTPVWILKIMSTSLVLRFLKCAWFKTKLLSQKKGNCN